MSPAATAEQWLNTETIQHLTGISQQGLNKRVLSGFYKAVRYVEGKGRGGKVVQIALSCLPETLQAVYRAQQAIAAGCTETEQAAPESYHKVSETERKVAMERLRVVKAWELEQEQWPGVDKQDLLPAFCKRYGISRSTLYKWEADFRDNGLNGLLPAETRYGKRGSYKMEPEAYDYLLALYLNNRKRTVAYCYLLLKEAARDKGWRIPSLRSVQRIIKELPESVRMAAREHGKTVYDKCLPYTDRDTGKILSNQVWVGDHFRCDFFVKDHGKWIRPWITAWLDMRSRRFMGWTVCKTPSTGTIIDSFEEYAKKNPMSVLITADVTSTVKTLLEDILAGLGCKSTAGNRSQAKRQLVKELRDTNRMIIIDEAQHLKLPTLEAVRGIIYDLCHCGVLLVGNENVYNKMLGKQKAPFAQLFSRVGICRGFVQPRYQIGMDDIRQVFCQDIDLPEECLQYLHGVANKAGGLRSAIKLFVMSWEISNNSGEEMNLDMIKAAENYLIRV